MKTGDKRRVRERELICLVRFRKSGLIGFFFVFGSESGLIGLLVFSFSSSIYDLSIYDLTKNKIKMRSGDLRNERLTC